VDLPHGVRHQVFSDGWELEVSCRSFGAFGIVPFAIIWNLGILQATRAAFRSGAICCCCAPIMLLFYWAGYMLCWYAMMLIAGKTTIRVRGDEAELSNSVGWWRRRQRFLWSACQGLADPSSPVVSSRRRSSTGLDVRFNGLHFDPQSRVLWWGQVIAKNRHEEIRRIIFSHLGPLR
jgi:hypothetical protein